MNAGTLIEILETYESNTEVLVSLGPDDPKIRMLNGVREGNLLDGVRPIMNKSYQSVYFPAYPTHKPRKAAVLLA